MSETYFTDQIFKGSDLHPSLPENSEFENCTFNNCKFTDLSRCTFSECTFHECDLSMAKLNNTSFRDATFISCKLLGLHFENCNKMLFSVHFNTCLLNLSSFYQCNLKNSDFNGCQLAESDFAEANLSGTTLSNCELSGAIFDQTNLEKTDLRNSVNFSIDPETNRIKKAKFSANSLEGLLMKYNLHIE
ncbi:MAG: pentapeptide repeat-containing protein [Prolixibacteraceae bacterium]